MGRGSESHRRNDWNNKYVMLKEKKQNVLAYPRATSLKNISHFKLVFLSPYQMNTPGPKCNKNQPKGLSREQRVTLNESNERMEKDGRTKKKEKTQNSRNISLCLADFDSGYISIDSISCICHTYGLLVWIRSIAGWCVLFIGFATFSYISFIYTNIVSLDREGRSYICEMTPMTLVGGKFYYRNII